MTHFHKTSNQQNQPHQDQRQSPQPELINIFQQIITKLQTLQALNNATGTLKDYPVDQLIVDARSLGQALRRTNLEQEQIQDVLHSVNQLKTKLAENDFSTIKRELVLLKPKLAYVMSRNDALKPLSQVVVSAIDKVYGEEDFSSLTQLVQQITTSYSSSRNYPEPETFGSSDVDAETMVWLTDDSWDNLPPYEWGEQGVPQGKPVRYVPGVGLVVEGGKGGV